MALTPEQIQAAIQRGKQKQAEATGEAVAPQDLTKSTSLDEFRALRLRRQGQQQTEEGVPRVPKRSFLQKFGDISEKTFGRAGEALFGTFGKQVGRLGFTVQEGIKELATGKQIPAEERRGFDIAGRGEAPAPTVGEIAFTVLEILPGGKGLGKALSKLPGGATIAKGFKASLKGLSRSKQAKAVKLFTEALAPTTKRAKAATRKIVPELLERKETAGFLTGLGKLERKAARQIAKIGPKIDTLIEGLPGTTKIKIKPIMASISKFKQQFLVNGKIVNKRGAKIADDLAETMVQFGDDIDTKSLTKVKRIFDQDVAKAGGFSDKVAKIEAEGQKAITNAIRGEFAKDVPELTKLNKEFSFWKGVQEVTTETLKRKASQVGRRGRAAQILGALFGATTGSPRATAAGAFIGGKLSQAFGSAVWKTKSAVFKNNLAKNLADGKIKLVLKKLQTIGVVTNNEIRRFNEENKL